MTDHESEDQTVLRQSSQVIFASCDNVDNDHESDIQVPKEFCSYRDQNLNENHERTQINSNECQKKRPPEYLKDYHCNLNVPNTSSRVKYPLNSILSHFYTCFVMSLSSHVEQNTYFEVMKHDCWRKAIQCEISALKSNQTWETALLHKDKIVIGCK